MKEKTLSGWLCEDCGKELYWGEAIVVISGGVMCRQDEGPIVDNNPWWAVYHENCYLLDSRDAK